jgi:aminopeptidase N
MLSDFIGADVFQRGIRSYLQRFKFANASTSDLWQAMETESGLPIARMMAAWTRRVGFPVISVIEDAATTQAADGSPQRCFRLRQQRFLTSGFSADDATVWVIPISVVTGDAPHVKQTFLMDAAESVVVVQATATSWVKFNAGQTGFFRVQYATPLRQALLSPASLSAIPAIDRLGMWSDTFALAKAGLLSVTDVLQALVTSQAMHTETNAMVVADVCTNLGDINGLFGSMDELAPLLHRVFQAMFAPLLASVGLLATAGEESRVTLLRTNVVEILVASAQPDLLAQLRRMLTGSDSELAVQPADTTLKVLEVPAQLRLLAMNAHAKHGGAAAFDQLLTYHQTTDTPDEKRRALSALGKTREPSAVLRLLEWVVGPSGDVRLQDWPIVFASIGSHPVGRQVAWAFVTANWERIEKMTSSTSFLIARIIEGLVSGLSNEQDIAHVEEFFLTHPVPLAERTLRQALESAKSRAVRRQRDGPSLAAFLQTL